LIFATSDSADSIFNKALRMSDTLSRDILRRICDREEYRHLFGKIDDEENHEPLFLSISRAGTNV
jgi:hypothetical protein